MASSAASTRAVVKRTACNRDCPDACSMLATVEGGRVTRIVGDPDHPVTRGFLCWRTNQFLETQYSASRLTTPLLRKGGSFEPVGWDEALDFVASGLMRIRDESGPAAVFHYRSGGSLGLLTATTDLFFERFGPVTTKRGDICSGAGEAAQQLDFGVSDSSDLFDLLQAKNVILWGKNVFVSSPHTLMVLKEAKRRGTALALVDPVHHRTASICDRHWQPRPGGDFALAMAVAQCLFERDWIDPGAATYCDNLGELRDLAFSRGVTDWCRLADVEPRAALDLAQRLGPGGPCAILVGWGMGRRRNGGAIVRALDALGAISGNLGVSGGGVSFYFRRRGAFDTTFGTKRAAPPRTICEPLFGPEVLAADEPPIRALWVTAGNPVAMLPDSHRVAEAIRSRELVVVTDAFLTDTAALAHVVLPTPTLLEADDLIGAYGHHWLTATEPVVPPPEGVKSDLEIVQALAQRVGLSAEMHGSARSFKDRLVQKRLAPAGITRAALERGPVRNPLAPTVLFADRRFPTRTGRVNLIDRAPDVLGPTDDGEYPFELMALSTAKSQSSQWAKAPPAAPAEVTVHPRSVPFDEGTSCRLESRIGSLLVRVRFDAEQRDDVVLMAKGGHLGRGACANALLRAAVTDLGEGGALYEERVRLVPVDEP